MVLVPNEEAHFWALAHFLAGDMISLPIFLMSLNNV